MRDSGILNAPGVFYACPGDVGEIRKDSMQWLSQRYKYKDAKVKPYAWIHDRGRSGFPADCSAQESLPDPGDPMIKAVVCLIGERLGSPLEPEFDESRLARLRSNVLWQHVRHPWPTTTEEQEQAITAGQFPLTGTTYELLSALSEDDTPTLVLFLAPEQKRNAGADSDLETRKLANLIAAFDNDNREMTEWDPRTDAERGKHLHQTATFKPLFTVDNHSNALNCIKAFLQRSDLGLMHPGANRNPFKFLEPYEVVDNSVFFGRDEETRHIAETLEYDPDTGDPPPQRLLHLVGTSGSGKSSLLRAGVVGDLHYRALTEHAYCVARPAELIATYTSRVGLTDQFAAAADADSLDEAQREREAEIGQEGLAALHAACVAALDEQFPPPGTHESDGSTAAEESGANAEATCPDTGPEVAADLAERVAQRLGDKERNGRSQPGRLVVALDQAEELINDLAMPGGVQRWGPLLACLDAMSDNYRFVVLSAIKKSRLPEGQITADLPNEVCGPFLSSLDEDECKQEVTFPVALHSNPATLQALFRKRGLELEDRLVKELMKQIRGLESSRGEGAFAGSVLPLVGLALSHLYESYRQNVEPKKNSENRNNHKIHLEEVRDSIDFTQIIDATCEEAIKEVETQSYLTMDPKQQRQDAVRHVLLPLIDVKRRRAEREGSRGEQPETDTPPFEIKSLRENASPTDPPPARSLANGLFRRHMLRETRRRPIKGAPHLHRLTHESVVENWRRAHDTIVAELQNFSLAHRLREAADRWNERKAEAGSDVQAINFVPPDDHDKLYQFIVDWSGYIAPPHHGAEAQDPRLWDFLSTLIIEEFDEQANLVSEGTSALLLAAQSGHTNVIERLLTQGADANEVSPENGAFPLLMAAQNGHAEVVERLLHYGADANQVNHKMGNFPLVLAANNGHTEVVELLLEHGADVNQTTPQNGSFPLVVAAETGHAEVVERLIHYGADANQVNHQMDNFPLGMAAQNGHAEVVELLLEHGADVNQTTPQNGSFPLVVAAETGHAEVVDRLLKHGAEVNQVSSEMGFFPLLRAATNGHTEVVERLLAHGAEVNLIDSVDDLFPLLTAAQNGHAEVVERLLAHGAEANLASSGDGRFPLLMAAQNGHAEVVEHLLAYGADLNQMSSDNGAFPLLAAAQNGHIDVIERVLAHGADVNRVGPENGAFPLLLAAQNGHVEVAERLLAHGADVNKVSPKVGTFPLLIAAQNGHIDVVERLLAHGAEANQVDSAKGTFPLLMAAVNGQEQVVRKLLQYGANIDQQHIGTGFRSLDFARKQGNRQIEELLLAHGANS